MTRSTTGSAARWPSAAAFSSDSFGEEADARALLDLHAFQVERNARDLLEEATRAEEQGEPYEAIDYLVQYLALQRKDTDARARLGLLLDSSAATAGPAEAGYRRAAYATLDQVLVDSPDRRDIRRRVAEMLVAMGRFADAREHVEILLNAKDKDPKDPPDPELLILHARCYMGERRLSEAEADLGKVPTNIPLRVELATQYRARDKNSDADRVMDELVTKKDLAAEVKPLEARRALAGYYLRFGPPAKAAEHLAYARDKLECQDADVLLMSAEAAQLQGKVKSAREYLEKGVKKYPDDIHLVLELARLESQQGQKKEALARLQPYLKSLPSKAEDLWQLGIILADVGEQAGVTAVVAQLKQLKTTGAPAAAGCLEAHQLMEEGKWPQARAVLEKLDSAAQGFQLRVTIDLLVAECYRRLHNPDQQIAACRRVLAAAPSSLKGRQLLASGLAVSGNTEAAIVEYRKIVTQTSVKEGPGLQAARELAGLLLARGTAETGGQRRGSSELDALEKTLRDSDNKTTARNGLLLEARRLALAEKTDQSRKILKKLQRDEGDKEVEPWLLLVAVTEKEKKRKDILPLLEQAESKTGKHVEWELARVRYWMQAEDKEAARPSWSGFKPACRSCRLSVRSSCCGR
jgi:tetratricopeptide (TPR) repeat protein